MALSLSLPSADDGALELLPALQRAETAGRIAQDSYAKDSAAKALATARDFWEVSGQPLDQAQAQLLMGIALRRMGKPEQAAKSYRTCKRLLAPALGESAARARTLALELYLEQAIFAFVSDDYLESARLNERAAKLGDVGAAPARAWLNAAISWDRLAETRETQRCLERAGNLLAQLPASSLHNSYELFRWRMSLDRGPLLAPPALGSGATRSQLTLFALYDWEHRLLRDDFAASAAARARLEILLRENRESQFARETAALVEAEALLFIGGRSPLTTAKLLSLLSAKESPPALVPLCAGMLVRLLVSGSKKNLETLAQACARDPRPILQAWGERACFWIACRKHDALAARLAYENAARLAQANGLMHFLRRLDAEWQAYHGGRAQRRSPVGVSPQEARAWDAFLTLLPGSHGQVVHLSPVGREEKDEAAALIELDTYLATGPHDSMLIVDGLRGQVLAFGRELDLDRMPIQRRMLLALVAAYPAALPKAEIVSQVWEEVYNPLVHDTVLYRTISRLRTALVQSAPRSRSGARPSLVLDSRGLRLAIDRQQLWAVLPDSAHHRHATNLNERQIRILTLLKYRGRVTRTEAVRALETPLRTVARDLAILVDRKLILRTGRGPASVYQPAV